MQSKKQLLIVLFVIIASWTGLYGITIKLGSLAPANSLWDKSLKELAAEWSRLSNGKVVLKIYPGGIAGDEDVMIRKIKLRQLHAAAITCIGINKIEKGILSISVPMLIRTEDELFYILERMTPYLEKELEKKQFIAIGFTFAGWVHFFTRNPVRTPEDLKNQKMWLWEGSPAVVQIWKKAGFSVIPLGVPDILTSLQSGMIDGLATSPLSAAVYQWFAVADNMTAINWAPMTAGLLISKSIWQKIPEDLRPQLKKSARNILQKVNTRMIEADNEAIAIMQQHGLVVQEVTPEDEVKWEKLVEENFEKLISTDFGEEAYNLVLTYLEEYRNQKNKSFSIENE
ncbi:MAG: TRAP transporter substrate-binding protein DctP [Spirochaetales bacterium]|nr:TRAP transporter substrate-binding protein DctP [Spirochaetales bacterium]